MSTQDIFEEALQHHLAGRLSDAELLYRRVLDINPNHSDALHYLGIIAHQIGRNDIAIDLINKAIEFGGHAVAMQINLGVSLKALGRFDEALRSVDVAMALDANVAEAHALLGSILFDVGRWDEALNALGNAIKINPKCLDAHINTGYALKALGRYEAAAQAFLIAIEINPESALSYFNLGHVQHRLGQFNNAIASYLAAVKIDNSLSDVYAHLGASLYELGRMGEAISAFRLGLSIIPDELEAQSNLGVVLHKLGWLEEAKIVLKRAIQIDPYYAVAHSHLGVVLFDQRYLNESIEVFSSALTINPYFAEAYGNKGNPLRALGRLGDAVRSYLAAIVLHPSYPLAYSNLGRVLADMGNIENSISAIQLAIRLDPCLTDAQSNLLFTLHYQPGVGEQAILEAAQRFAKCIQRSQGHFNHLNDPNPKRRLRIGYVSGDFRRHPIGFFMVSILANHDRTDVEVYCYSTNPNEDDLTKRLQSSADHWRLISSGTDDDAANLVVNDQIDVLVDLSGQTAFNRMPMFARKPAPVQVTWMGSFSTTGLSAMDYILADQYVAPMTSALFYTEKIWHLPGTYLCFSPPDFDCNISPTSTTETKTITFGTFNNRPKLSAFTIELYARVLKAVPGSRLFVKTAALDDIKGRESLLTQFSTHDIESHRLVVEGASPRPELMAAYNRVDIALDSAPYGGGITTIEALWMGVPVVTLVGDTWVGRLGQSILSTLGLPELIAACADDYVKVAVRLAKDTGKRMELRATLRSRVYENLCNGAQFTRDLELAYRSMWRAWCACENNGD